MTPMATLNSLKAALRRQTKHSALPLPKRPLSDSEYSLGFDTFLKGSISINYLEFIVPHLSQVVEQISSSHPQLSVLEIGPGPRSVLEYLPRHLSQKISQYDAFEPNGLFAARLEAWSCGDLKTEIPLPELRTPTIHQIPFGLHDDLGFDTKDAKQMKYDLVIFCHSMYGMKPKHKFIQQALHMLAPHGRIVVFHREDIAMEGLIPHQTAIFPTGVVSITNEDATIDHFAAFVAGYTAPSPDIRDIWRKECRTLGRSEEGQLVFRAPEIMMTFSHSANALPELMAMVPSVKDSWSAKNREARSIKSASVLAPTEVEHVQTCVRWALKHDLSLTVVGGGHSGHCLWPHTVAIDMGAFNKLHIVQSVGDGNSAEPHPSPLVVVGAGCKTGDIISKTLEADITVPLGARPSVGAGLWLQGGLGHLMRLHGLACDAIVGAVLVSVASAQVYYIGIVPSQNRPKDSVRPENEHDMLWALRGAGTNFGIVISVIFKSYPARNYLVRNWTVPLTSLAEAQREIAYFDNILAKKLDFDCSADAYLLEENGRIQFGQTVYESYETGCKPPTSMLAQTYENDMSVSDVNGVEAFESEMYMSGMHGGHSSGKTSSFKRCVFLKDIGQMTIADSLMREFELRPSSLCYFHLLQGGGVAGAVAADATAFGCRDWDFACVITGVWPRDRDGDGIARRVVDWVYATAERLLSFGIGCYSADLGPDPRDAKLAARAYHLNGPRLARLKQKFDPQNVLAYVCPLPKVQTKQKVIILVTGDSCAGKDYCAELWVETFNECDIKSAVRSISDGTKRAYASAMGADFKRLQADRAYKELHRSALTSFWKQQVARNAVLPEQNFVNLVLESGDTDVLFITGMRDEAPVATFSHLVSNCRLLEIQVHVDNETIRRCQGKHLMYDQHAPTQDTIAGASERGIEDSQPDLIFNNSAMGSEAAVDFCNKKLFLFLDEGLQELANMARRVANFPGPGIDFRHVLGISQQPGGLALSTSLLNGHFHGDWSKIDAVVCCEVGGLVFASPLAMQVAVPMILVRKTGKLPPPTLSVTKPSSYISSLASGGSEIGIEIEQNVLTMASSIVIVDDVLSTGKTLWAMLKLLNKTGVNLKNISVMVVAEFPAHRGRNFLYQSGFGGVRVQSLLVFGGA